MRIATQHYSALLVVAIGDKCDSRNCAALVLWLSADDEHSMSALVVVLPCRLK